MRRKIILLLAVAFQLVVLAVMAIEREYIVRYGNEIYLRTAPIDPRDLFRGDYVRLDYEISTIPGRYAQGGLADKGAIIPKGSVIYTMVTPGEEGLATLQTITDRKPEDGLFIKGRLRYERRADRPYLSAFNLKYGIEAYFVEQGQGLKMEKKRGSRTGVQVPLEMKMALGSDGTAVLKDHRWSRLGIGLKMLRQGRERNQSTAQPVSSKIALTLKNVSEAPLVIVDLADQCSFALEPISQVAEPILLANAAICQPRQPVTDQQLITLAPTEKKTWEFDFSDPRWQVIHEQKTVEIGSLAWRNRFRLIYRPPTGAALAHLSRSAQVWQGYLPSRAFHGRGQID